jgi:hypothetical protein
MNPSLRRAHRVLVAALIGVTVLGTSAAAHADTKPQNYAMPMSPSVYGNGCTEPGPNLLLDTSPLLVDPSPWAAPWVFVVNFRPACDMHDAGYDGGIVYHPFSGVVMDTRGMSRSSIDYLFYVDLMSSCNSQIGANAMVARSQCYAQASVYYGSVRGFAASHFDASPDAPGLQSSGTRPND